MSLEPRLEAVLRHYPDVGPIKSWRPLGGAGGFSGAEFWRLETDNGPFCLRRWPAEHPNRERLEFIQAVLWQVHQEGCYFVPLPLETATHAGYVRHDGRFWELTPWMPGKADYHLAPTNEKLRNALTALATFHTAAASFPVPMPGPAPSPGIAQRLELAQRLDDRRLAELQVAVGEPAWPEVDQRARRALALLPRALPAAVNSLVASQFLTVPIQPCIRDIWHDHVLFLDGQVSGIIDFGAMRIDSIATDVARLLGSLVGDERDGWRMGLEAYEAARPLAEEEGQLIKAFDRSGVVLSVVNWLRWIYVERRTFEHRSAVEARLDELLPRLERLTELK